MKTKVFIMILILLSGCLPDRLPPEPVEQERPLFLTLLQPDGILIENPDDSLSVREQKITAHRGFPVSLNTHVVLGFNEPMDVSSFPGNVVLAGGTDTVTGRFFSRDPVFSGDTAVYPVEFVPERPLMPLKSYWIIIKGGVKDTAGNSMSIQPGFNITYEFSTGDTAALPRVLVADRANGLVNAVDTFNLWTFTDLLSLPTSFVSLQDGRIVITDEGSSTNFLKVFNPDGSVSDSIMTGGRQNGASKWGSYFVVTTKSPRAYFVIDETLEITDSSSLSHTPKRAVMNGSFVYVLTTLRSIVIIDRSTGDQLVIGNLLLHPLRSPNMDVNENTGEVALNDYNGERIVILRGTDTSYIQIPGYHPTDLDYRKGDTLVVSTEEGHLLFIDTSTGNIEDRDLGASLTSVSTMGNFVYAYSPDLTAGGETGFLIIVGSEGEILRGVNIGSSGSKIFLTRCY